MNENIKNEKKYQRKHREIYLVLLLLLAISVGFSYLTTQLDIIGNTTVTKQSWNIHFGNPTETTGNITGTNRAIADRGNVALKSGTTLEVDFTATLDYPGDYYEFTVPVINAGSIDAMIDTAGITNILNPTSDLITYSVTYADGTTDQTKAIAVGDGLHAGKNNLVKVRIEYKKDVTNDQVNNMAAGGLSISSTYSMTFVQATNAANYKSFERNNS
ncbi:MAG: hypothetical protein Q4E69_05440 [Bacilli bacterium]|nr:hypothetical protein [Bacilli bacterium]